LTPENKPLTCSPREKESSKRSETTRLKKSKDLIDLREKDGKLLPPATENGKRSETTALKKIERFD